MKSVFVFALFVIIAMAQASEDELKEKFAELSKNCAVKTNFSEENLKKLRAQDFTETENIQCFQKCFFEDAGIVTDKGIDEDKILSFGRALKKDESTTKQSIANCSPLYKAETFDCDAAWEIYKCFHPKE